MYMYLLGLAMSNLCVLVTAIPALHDISTGLDDTSFATAFYQVKQVPLLYDKVSITEKHKDTRAWNGNTKPWADGASTLSKRSSGKKSCYVLTFSFDVILFMKNLNQKKGALVSLSTIKIKI